jgi:hypothetical protein
MSLFLASLAFAASKIQLHFEKAESVDGIKYVMCSYRELDPNGISLRIMKEGTTSSCPKIIYYDPETQTWTETP